MNVQFAIQGDVAGGDMVYVLEVNPRLADGAVRRKATGSRWPRSRRCMVGQRLADQRGV